MKYRPDIDGLRALAVVLVVAFHIHLPGFHAGFIGVDVFFVISGYLITSLLTQELEGSGGIRLARFYERRIRRLAPAISLVLASVMLVGVFLLHPFGQQQQLYRSAIAAALFVANVYFAETTGGYFQTSMDDTYLLHFWSLSVEEQFYIVWPLIMLAAAKSPIAARLGRIRTISLVAAILALSSFARGLYLVSRADDAAYFMMAPRAWQLLSGSLTALALHGNAEASRPRTSVILQTAALALLGAGLWVIDGPGRHPGLPALLPTFATVFFIVGGRGASNPIQSVMSSRPVVLIGKLSFSWYLWHWPLIAVSRSRFFDSSGTLRDVFAVLVALGLAGLTFHYVEEPFRRRIGAGSPPKRILAVGVAAAMGIVLLAGGLGYVARHSNLAEPWWYTDPRLESARFTRSALRKNCHQDTPFETLAPRSSCVTGTRSAPVRLLLLGDSHADHLAPLAAAFGKRHGIGVLQRSFSDCRPAIGTYDYLKGDVATSCRAFHEQVLAEVAELADQGLQGVVISGYWWGEFRVEGFDGVAGLTLGLSRAVHRFRELGLNVLLVAPLPVLPFDAVECVARRPDARCGLSRADWDHLRAPVLDSMRRVASTDAGVRIADFSDFFCDAERCRVGNEEMLFFRDTNHLTPRASEALLPISENDLKWASSGPFPLSAARPSSGNGSTVRTGDGAS